MGNLNCCDQGCQGSYVESIDADLGRNLQGMQNRMVNDSIFKIKLKSVSPDSPIYQTPSELYKSPENAYTVKKLDFSKASQDAPLIIPTRTGDDCDRSAASFIVDGTWQKVLKLSPGKKSVGSPNHRTSSKSIDVDHIRKGLMNFS